MALFDLAPVEGWGVSDFGVGCLAFHVGLSLGFGDRLLGREGSAASHKIEEPRRFRFSRGHDDLSCRF